MDIKQKMYALLDQNAQLDRTYRALSNVKKMRSANFELRIGDCVIIEDRDLADKILNLIEEHATKEIDFILQEIKDIFNTPTDEKTN